MILSAVEGFTEALNKELPPSWNIKAIVVQPGGFKTEWNKGNMIRMKPHLAYTDPSAPGMLFRQMTDHVTYVGDVQKGKQDPRSTGIELILSIVILLFITLFQELRPSFGFQS